MGAPRSARVAKEKDGTVSNPSRAGRRTLDRKSSDHPRRVSLSRTVDVLLSRNFPLMLDTSDLPPDIVQDLRSSPIHVGRVVEYVTVDLIAAMDKSLLVLGPIAMDPSVELITRFGVPAQELENHFVVPDVPLTSPPLSLILDSSSKFFPRCLTDVQLQDLSLSSLDSQYVPSSSVVYSVVLLDHSHVSSPIELCSGVSLIFFHLVHLFVC